MKKPGDERFEKELLQALRGPMRAQERNAARTRVAKRLQDTLSHLEVGAASALPLLLEAPQVAATQSPASVAASTKALAAGAMASGTGAAGAALATAHPLGALLAAFALGAGAGGGALVVLSAGHVFERGALVESQAPAAKASAVSHKTAKTSAQLASDPASFAPSPSSSHGVSAEPSLPAHAPARRAAAAATVASDAPRADTLTAQQALLDRARAALARGDGGQALAALSEHARVHPASELAEEREALTIKSLIAFGDPAAARARAALFAARYPRSLFLPSIRTALPENP